MRKFHFRLEHLLRYRRSLTQQERINLAQKIGSLSNAENNASELRGIRNSTKIEHLRSLESGTTAKEIVNLHEHIVRIDEAIDLADEDIEKAIVEVDKARDKLVIRRRDERAIEIYRKRRFNDWLQDYYRDENRILDDLSTIRHVRQVDIKT